MIPADGDIWWDFNGDVFPWSGENSVHEEQFVQIEEGNSAAPIPFRIDSIVAVGNEIHFTVNRNYDQPWLKTLSFNDNVWEAGTTFQPTLTVTNFGGNGDSLMAICQSANPIFTELTMRYNQPIDYGDTVVMVSDQLVSLANNPDYWGAILPLWSDFSEDNLCVDTAYVKMHRLLWPTRIFSAKPQTTNLDNWRIDWAGDSVFAYNGNSLLWQRRLSGEVTDVCIADLAGTSTGSVEAVIVLNTPSGKVIHVRNMLNGNSLDSWPTDPMTPLANPDVMLVKPNGQNQSWITWAQGNIIRIEDVNHLPYYDTPTSEVITAPFAVNYWAFMSDGIFGDRLVLIGGNEFSGTWVQIDLSGEQMFPEGLLESYDIALGPVLTGDFTHDGIAEFVCLSGTEQAGYYGTGTWAWSRFYQEPNFVLGTTGNRRIDPETFGTYGPDTANGVASVTAITRLTSNYAVLGFNNRGLTLGTLNYPYWLASFDPVGDGNQAMIMAGSNEVRMYSAQATGFIPGNASRVYRLPAGLVVDGAPIFVYDPVSFAYQMGIVAHDTLAGVWRQIWLETFGAQAPTWSGRNGSANNNRFNPHLGSPPDFGGDCPPGVDTIFCTASTVISPNHSSLALWYKVCGHPEWVIEGYKVEVDTTMSGENFFQFTTFVPPAEYNRSGFHLIPVSNLPDKGLVHIRALLSDEPDELDGYWLWQGRIMEFPVIN